MKGSQLAILLGWMCILAGYYTATNGNIVSTVILGVLGLIFIFCGAVLMHGENELYRLQIKLKNVEYKGIMLAHVAILEELKAIKESLKTKSKKRRK